MTTPIILRRDHELYNEGRIRIVSRYQRVLTKVEFDYLEAEQLFLKEHYPIIYAKCYSALYNETNVKRLKHDYYTDRYLVFCYEHNKITGACSIHFDKDNLVCDYVCGSLNAQQMMLEALSIYEADCIRIFIPEYNRDLKTSCRKTVGVFFGNTVDHVRDNTRSKYDLTVRYLNNHPEFAAEYHQMNKDYISNLRRFESIGDLEMNTDAKFVWLFFNNKVPIGMIKLFTFANIAYVSLYVKPTFHNQHYSSSMYTYIPDIIDCHNASEAQLIEYIYHRCSPLNTRSYQLGQSIFKEQIASDCI